MKVILTTILATLAHLGSVVSCIWAIVEFILYLVKDKVFNWWSVWMILICVGLAVAMSLLSVVFASKLRGKRSIFQERFAQHNRAFRKF